MRVSIASLVLAIGVGCATLPEVHPWVQTAGEGGAPTIVTSGGTLTPARSEALLTRLAKEGSDLLARHVAVEEGVSGAPLVLGNAVALLNDGPVFYQAMFEAIEAARDHVNVEFYIVEDDAVGRRFSAALLAKAAQGVAVNFMYDSVGSIRTPPAFFERLRAGGVRVVEYNPVNPLKARAGWRINNRNHRKVVIVDGHIAFTGGINISEVYSADSSPGAGTRAPSGSAPRAGSGITRTAHPVGWRDTNLRVEGPVVAQFQQLFLETWAKQGGPALPERNWYPPAKPAGKHPVRVLASGPDRAVPAIYVSVLSAIVHAEKTVHITMAYFVPDAQMMEALTAAARRGVEVVLVLPSYTDFWAVFHAGRAHYAELLDAGVRIYERQEALLHAKTIVIDGVWSTVGSSNLDWRSFLHNQEVNAVVLGWDFGRQMETMFQRDLARSVLIERSAWARRPLTTRMKEWAARVWEYWL